MDRKVGHGTCGGAAFSSGAQNSRLRTAAAVLVEAAGIDQDGADARDFLADSFTTGRKGRSEAGSSEVSSHLLDPTWQRLLKSIARSLSYRLSVAEGAEGKGVVVSSAARDHQLEAALTSGDGGGGGSVADFEHFLGDIFENLDLKDRDSGHLLLLAYYHLQPEDVPLSARTWRPLLVTALHIGAVQALPDFMREVARKKLAEKVRHWWSAAQINAASDAFRARKPFAGEPRRSDLAKLYFDLRENGLRIAPQDSEIGSSEAVAEMSFNLEPETPTQTGIGNWGRRDRVDQSEDSGRLEESANLYDITESSVSLGTSSLKQSYDTKDLRTLSEKSTRMSL